MGAGLLRTKTFVVLLVAAVLGVGLLAAPAEASIRRFDDPRGDARAALDVSALTVRNARTRVRVTLHVPRLERRRLGGVTVFVGRKAHGRPEYSASKVRRGAHRWRTTWQEFDESRMRCRGLHVRVRPHRVVVSIPQHCLGDNRSPVRVQAAVFSRAYLAGNVPEEVLFDPHPGPTLPIDGVPGVRGTRMTDWVPYRSLAYHAPKEHT